jgi:hypothetical protein
MKSIKAGVAKRLTLSLVALVSVGGGAVYSQPPPYTYFDGNGQTVYASPVEPAPVYIAPPYVGPAYIGPPVFLNFGFNSWGGRRGYYGGHYRGGRGHWR